MPGVEACAVIALPDQEWGSRVVAVVETGRARRSRRVWPTVRDFVVGSASALVGAARRAGGAARCRCCESGKVDRQELVRWWADAMTRSSRRCARFELPMSVRFRGVTVAAGRADAGATRAGPSSARSRSTATTEAARWLAAALEAADVGIPGSRCATGCRSTARSRPSARSRRPRSSRAPHGCRTAKVKVAEPGQTLADDVARVGAVRDALGPDGRVRVDANGGWSVARGGRGDQAAGRVRPRVRRAAVPHRRRAARGPQPRRRADRRRRVDPQGQRPLAGKGSRGRRHRGAQGAAARRGARLPAARRADRHARWWCRARWSRRSASPPGSPWPRRCPSCPTPAGWRRRRCSTGDLVARSDARSSTVSSTYAVLSVDRRRAGAARADAADDRSWWLDRLARCQASAGGSTPMNDSTHGRGRGGRLRCGGAASPTSCSRPARARPHSPSSLHQADAEGLIRLHVRVDERTAGFLALGLAKGSHRPVAVVTTSGTAVANLHPAVLEASHVGQRLIVLSADRPGRAARHRRQPDDRPGRHLRSARALRRRRARATSPALEAAIADGCRVNAARPQVNLQFAEPLMPDALPCRAVPTSSRRLRRATTARSSAPRGDAEPLPSGPRTVVVAGDDAGPPARLLAQRAEWPLLAEPTSGSRTGTHAIRTYRLLLGTELGEQIERVVVAGHPTLSRPVTRLISRADIEVISVRGAGGVCHRSRPGRPAPRRDADRRRGADADEPGSSAWRAADQRAGRARSTRWRERAARPAARRRRARSPRRSAPARPAGRRLLAAGPRPRPDDDAVSGRRSAGWSSATAGWPASTARCRPRSAPRSAADSSRAIAYIGDVTFLHDLTGLVIGPDEPRPDLTIVVANDDGGAIFATLEQGDERYAGVVRAGLRHAARRLDRGWCAATRRRTPGSTTTDAAGCRSWPSRSPASTWSRCRSTAPVAGRSTPRSRSLGLTLARPGLACLSRSHCQAHIF